MSLIEKLTAALDETEDLATEAAEQVGDGNWQQRAARIVTVADRDREVADYAIVECIDHIVHNDPDRVLRRVARDRKVLERHKPVEMPFGYFRCYSCREDHTAFGEWDNVSQPVWWPCDEARDLAEAYGIEVE